MKLKPQEGQKRDHALYFLEKGDPDFSPEKNKTTIENSIKKYEAMRRKKWHEFDDAYAERSDAIVTYIRAIDRGGVSTKLDHYFTPNEIRVLRGDEIRQKIHEGVQLVKGKHQLKRVS